MKKDELFKEGLAGLMSSKGGVSQDVYSPTDEEQLRYHAAKMEQRGRPKNGEIKVSRRVKTNFALPPEILTSVTYISLKIGRTQRDVIEALLRSGIERYEEAHGVIPDRIKGCEEDDSKPIEELLFNR